MNLTSITRWASISLLRRVCGGRPTFKYTRIDVRHALGLLASGRTVEQVAHGYDIPVEAVQEALELAAHVFDRHGGRLARRA